MPWSRRKRSSTQPSTSSRQLQKDLDKYKKYESSDASLKELAGGVSLYLISAEKRKSLIDETLWPRPGDISDMYERVKASVPFVKVTTTIEGHKAKATASGFLIKPPGLGYLVVTNRHVVNDAPDGYTLRFLPPGKSSRDSSDDIKVDPNAVVHIARKEDLAVIKLPAKATPVLEKLKVHPLSVAKKLKVGEPIWVVGNPGAGAEGTLIQAAGQGRRVVHQRGKRQRPDVVPPDRADQHRQQRRARAGLRRPGRGRRLARDHRQERNELRRALPRARRDPQPDERKDPRQATRIWSR